MTLARVSISGSAEDIAKAVELILSVIQNGSGEPLTAEEVEIRIHAVVGTVDEFEPYLRSDGPKLDIRQRVMIVQALADIIRSRELHSGHDADFYTGYFNVVCAAFQLTPANIAGLIDSFDC